MSPSLETGNVAALGTLPAPSRNNAAGKRGPKRSAIAGRRRAQIRRVSPPPGILGKGAGHSVARSAYFVRLRSQKAAFWQDIAEMYSSTAFFQLKAYKMYQFCQNRLSERTFRRYLAILYRLKPAAGRYPHQSKDAAHIGGVFIIHRCQKSIDRALSGSEC